MGENLENGHFRYEKKIFFPRSISTVIASGIDFMPSVVSENHQQRLLMDILIYLSKTAFMTRYGPDIVRYGPDIFTNAKAIPFTINQHPMA